MRVRRVVEMRRGKPGKGGHPRTWGYGFPELAELFGMTEGAVRQAVLRGTFDPGSLRSILDYCNRRRARGIA